MTKQHAEYVSGLQQTWQSIGPDVLQMTDGEAVDRDDVIELTLDQFDMYRPQLATAFRTEPTEVRKAVLKQAFPTESYC